MAAEMPAPRGRIGLPAPLSAYAEAARVKPGFWRVPLALLIAAAVTFVLILVFIVLLIVTLAITHDGPGDALDAAFAQIDIAGVGTDPASVLYILIPFALIWPGLASGPVAAAPPTLPDALRTRRPAALWRLWPGRGLRASGGGRPAGDQRRRRQPAPSAPIWRLAPGWPGCRCCCSSCSFRLGRRSFCSADI